MTEKDKLYRTIRWLLYLLIGFFVIIFILAIVYAVWATIMIS